MPARVKLTGLIVALALVACSEEPNTSAEGEHVWNAQVESLDKAKEVEALMQNATQETRDAIEQSNY